MATDKRKFRGTTPVTPLNKISEKISTHTPTDRVQEYTNAMRTLRAFREKLRQIRNSGNETRIEKCKKDVWSRIETAKRAREELRRLGIDPKQI